MRASARTGARCSQVDGLYDHLRGTSGPAIVIIIGISTANTATRPPTNVSFAYAAASGAQKTSGAKANHKPTNVFAQAAQARPVRKAIAPSAITNSPLSMSLQINGTLR